MQFQKKYEWIANAIPQLSQLLREKEIINSFELTENKEHTLVKIVLNVKCLIDKETTAEQFSMIINIPEEYPKAALSCITAPNSPVPFHPHFRVIKTETEAENKTSFYGEWIDYRLQNKSEKIADFISRIYHSLNRKKEFIDLNAEEPGNPEALVFYKELPEKQGHLKQSSSNAPDKAFEIKKEHPLYTPIKKELNGIPIISGLSSSNAKSIFSRYKLLLQEVAQKRIWEHIGYGHSYSSNRIEQGGILVGWVGVDNKTKDTYGIVEDAIPALKARAGATHLEIGHKDWKKMIDEADQFIDEYPDNRLQIIGWYHTHPNRLDVFMSGVDMLTQRSFFNQDWHFAMVINPHREIWKVYQGAQANECPGYVINPMQSETSVK